MRGVEHGGTSIKSLFSEAVVHVVRREETHAGVMVLKVVRIEEIFAVRPAVFEAPESFRKIWRGTEITGFRTALRER